MTIGDKLNQISIKYLNQKADNNTIKECQEEISAIIDLIDTSTFVEVSVAIGNDFRARLKYEWYSHGSQLSDSAILNILNKEYKNV